MHKIFLEEEDEPKPKLQKINYDDNSDVVQPVPYTKPQNKLTKYQELLNRKKKLLKEANLRLVNSSSSKNINSSSSSNSSSNNSNASTSKISDNLNESSATNSRLELQSNLLEENKIKTNSIENSQKGDNTPKTGVSSDVEAEDLTCTSHSSGILEDAEQCQTSVSLLFWSITRRRVTPGFLEHFKS